MAGETRGGLRILNAGRVVVGNGHVQIVVAEKVCRHLPGHLRRQAGKRATKHQAGEPGDLGGAHGD